MRIRLANGSTITVGPSTLIGRASDAALRIADPRVSRHHAAIQHTEDAWFLRDLGSQNGTSVDGRRLPAGYEHRLRVGEHVRIGATNEAPATFVVEAIPTGAARTSVVAEVDRTADARASGPAVALVLHVSDAGKNVAVQVVREGRSATLPARAPFRVLLLLAEARDASTRTRSGSTPVVWLSTAALRKRLGLSRKGLNSAVQRVRDALAAEGVPESVIARSDDEQSLALQQLEVVVRHVR